MADAFSATALLGFEFCFRPWLRRRVRLRLTRPPDAAPDRPLFFVANHSSWWDPFVLREIQRTVRPAAPVYTLMLETELAQRPFFKRIGAVGIDPGSPGSIRAAARRLREVTRSAPDACILFFPQGRIWPSTRRPLDFRRGLDFFTSVLAPLTLVPIALHVEPLASVRPTVFALAGQPISVAAPVAGAPRDAVTRRVETAIAELLDRLQRHVHQLGERAGACWPPEGS